MNPPYDKNLHLKILEQSINLLTHDGILVNLSPIRWLQDPLAKYKKTSDWYKFKEVREHTHKINVIIARDFQAMFGAIGNFDLGIYVIRKSVSPTPVSVINSVIERMSEFNHSNPAPLELDKYEIDLNDGGLFLNIVIGDYYIPNEQKTDYFVVTIYNINLPWVLNEPFPTSVPYKNSFFNKIKSLFSKK